MACVCWWLDKGSDLSAKSWESRSGAVISRLYSHDLKTKISFSASDQTLFTISILEEKCTCCIGFFFSSAASAAHVEHGCTCCQCIISTYRKHVCYLPQKTPMLWKSWLISCFYLKCLSILTSLKNFYCHVGPNSNLSVLLSDMLQWQWAEALWQFGFYAR